MAFLVSARTEALPLRFEGNERVRPLGLGCVIGVVKAKPQMGKAGTQIALAVDLVGKEVAKPTLPLQTVSTGMQVQLAKGYAKIGVALHQGRPLMGGI